MFNPVFNRSLPNYGEEIYVRTQIKQIILLAH